MKKHIKKLHNTKTYSLIIVIAFAVIGATLLVFSQAATLNASLTLSPSSRSIEVNSGFTTNFTTAVNVTSPQAFNGVNILMQYDATKLDVVSVVTTGTNFADCPTKTGTGGTITLVCYVSPPGTLTGTNLVANITFRPKVNTGTTTISFVKESDLRSKIALAGTGENIWNGVLTGGTFTFTAQDVTPPVTAITDPTSTSGPISGTKTITATASDAGGTVNRVEFLVNNVVKGTDTTAPYTYDWNTLSGTPDGAYTLTTKAYDNATTPNVGTSAPVSVTVKNNKPDLTVTSISLNPAVPDTGQAVTISAVVRNSGSEAIASGTSKATRLLVDNVAISTVTDTTALAIGASYTVTATATWTAASGTRSISAVADVSGQIAELNETNNTFNRSITVYNAGDTGITVGVVDFEDLLTVLNNWNGTGKTRTQGDLSGGDGVVDFEDLLKVLNNWTR